MSAATAYGPTGIRYGNGRPATNTPIQVVARGTSNPITVYVALHSDVLAPNPVHTDDQGNLSFYALPGSYDLLVNGARIAIEVVGQSDDALTAHISALSPHPAYDTAPNFTLLFENRLYE